MGGWRGTAVLGIGVAMSVVGGRLASAADPIGFHDETTCSIARGWTCDPDNYAAQLGVHFYLDGPAGGGGTFIGGTGAFVQREAAVGQVCGNGHAAHGFSWRPALAVNGGIPQDGLTHQIYAYAINGPGAGGNPLLGSSPQPVRCPQVGRTLYLQESVTDPIQLRSRVFADPTTTAVFPVNKDYIVLWQQGANADDQRISWAVGNYTGFFPPSPVTNYQFGVNTNSYGSVAVQWYGRTMGILNRPWTVNRSSSLIIPTVMAHDFNPAVTNLRPWPAGRTTVSEMSYQLYLRVPHSSFANGSVNYAQSYIVLRDATTGKWFWVGPSQYDNRGSFPSASIISESQGGCSYPCSGNPIVSFGYQDFTSYGHLGPGSYQSTGATWSGWRWYEFRMTRGELTSAILGIKQLFPAHAGISTRPQDYQLTGVYFLSEIAYPANSDATLGLSFKNIRVMEYY